MNVRLFLSTLLVLLMLHTACTLGPDPKRPETPADRVSAFVHAPLDETASPADVSRWWEGFQDSHLNALVDAALKHNPEITGAAARVLEAEASLRAARGTLYPELSYALGRNRQKTSFVLPTIGRTGIYSTTYSQDLTISYQVDLFGRLARSRQAAWAELLAARADREALTHAIIAGVIQARVLEATLRLQHALATDNTRSRANSLKMIETRYARGLVDPLDVHMARETLAASRSLEHDLAYAAASAAHALDILAGNYPGGTEHDSLPPLPELAPAPPGVPASLLDRRPDLKAAELRLAASTAGVGVAMANLFPSLSLTAGGGIRSDSLENLTSSDGIVYSALSNLLAPLFAGGKLKAEVEAAEARMEQMKAAYAGAVLNALKEVENALVQESTTRQKLRQLEIRMTEAKASEELARARYRQGVAPLLTLLETERKRRSAETELLQAKANLWNARVNLFLALGGDWGTDRSAAKTENPQTDTGDDHV